MHVWKLKERQCLKNIAREYNVVPALWYQPSWARTRKRRRKTLKRKITKEEKELRLKLHPLYQIMFCKEFDDLLENMHKRKDALRHDLRAAMIPVQWD